MNQHSFLRLPLWRHQLLATLAGVLLTGAGASALAAELRVRAPVVDVQPIREPATEVERCDGKPASGASLGETLAWDLGRNCRIDRIESSTVAGYRVFYRWDDRVYSQVMATAPGATIPLKIQVN